MSEDTFNLGALTKHEYDDIIDAVEYKMDDYLERARYEESAGFDDEAQHMLNTSAQASETLHHIQGPKCAYDDNMTRTDRGHCRICGRLPGEE